MQLLLEMATFVVLCTCSIYMIFGTYSECLKITQKSFGEVSLFYISSLRSQCCKKPLFGGDFQVLSVLTEVVHQKRRRQSDLHNSRLVQIKFASLLLYIA